MTAPAFLAALWAPLRLAGRLNLLHRFSLVSFIAVALVSVAQAALLARYIESQLLRHDAELSRQLVQSIVDTQGVQDYFERGEASGSRAGFEEFFGHIAAMPDVLRANVWGPDARVLWSSDPALIGRRFEHNDELEEALQGHTVVHRGQVSGDQPVGKAEHERLARTQTHFVENYLPVYPSAMDAGPPIGVVELYRLPSSLNAVLRSSALMVWASAIAGGVVLYLSTLGLVRRASRLMQQQRARMVEAEALALVGEIAASVAHSIRNPLASIRSGAELQVELGAEAPGEIARETVAHVDRIEHLVRTLLSYTRQPGEVQGTAEVAPALREAAERFAPSFSAQGKQFTFEAGAALPPVHGEAVVLVQLVNSLLANALEATAAGDRVALRACTEGDHVVVEVTDSGPGIEAQRLVDVFKPFHTSKPRGLGMGLALVKRALQRLGGDVDIDSRPGCTRARMRLRRADTVQGETPWRRPS
ncbi:sensor histidine kinase [Azohydromonas lata]|uniref:sensor histidine kinase n=1 Tax=Azohydromonas lata TaxID=45677 RepID=UPI001471194A|nr:ATP-binding protein [Azohydromonas lata]